MTVDVAVRARATLGESPRWDASASRLLWVDIEGRELHLARPDRGDDRTIAFDERVCAVAPTTGAALLVALAGRLVLVDPRTGSRDTLATVPHGENIRLNDGACDPAGRFCVGSMALDQRPGAGALYRFTPRDGLEQLLDGITLSNGLGWSPDGATMYYVDSPTRRVDAFDYDVETGTLRNRRPFARLEPGAGTPDGLAVDDDGGVTVALYGGGALRRYHADGSLDRVLELPATNATACCFGGEDGRSLFVTTARQALTQEELEREPDAGSVLVARADVAGPPARAFRL